MATTKNLDYITEDEITLVYTVKHTRGLAFCEIADEIGIGRNYFSKILNGKRPFPPLARQKFDIWAAAQKPKEKPFKEIHRKSIIPTFVKGVSPSGLEGVFRVPNEVLEDWHYRRCPEADRGAFLQRKGVVPLGWEYRGSVFEDTFKLSTEDWSKVRILMATYGLEGQDIAFLIGAAPQYWSNIMSGKKPIPLDKLKKLHMLFETYNMDSIVK